MSQFNEQEVFNEIKDARTFIRIYHTEDMNKRKSDDSTKKYYIKYSANSGDTVVEFMFEVICILLDNEIEYVADPVLEYSSMLIAFSDERDLTDDFPNMKLFRNVFEQHKDVLVEHINNGNTNIIIK